MTTSNTNTQNLEKAQRSRIAEMKAEVQALGGVVVTLEGLPLEIEEELLRQMLKRPDRGQLHPMFPALISQTQTV